MLRQLAEPDVRKNRTRHHLNEARRMAESLAIKMTVLNRFTQRSHLMPGRKARVRYSLHPRQSSGSAPMLVRVQNLVPGHSSGHRVPVCARLCWLRLCIPIIPSDTYVSKWRLTGRNGANMLQLHIGYSRCKHTISAGT